MRLLTKSGVENSAPLIGIIVLLGLVSACTALWFSWSYSRNAFDSAWGDPNFYSNLRFFWWGAVVSLTVLLEVAAFDRVRDPLLEHHFRETLVRTNGLPNTPPIHSEAYRPGTVALVDCSARHS